MTRRIASRLALVAPSPTLAVAAEAAKLKAQGIKVLDFSLGEPDLPSPEAVKRAGIEAIEADFTHYTPAAGIMDLRKAIAASYSKRHGIEIKPTEVLVGPGAKSVLFSAMMTLVNPGDEVVVVAPYWVSFPEQVKLAGGTPVFARTKWDDAFTVRAAAIEAVLTPATKAIIVNHPSNPCGGVLPREEAAKLAKLVRERDLWLISDETYEAFVYDQADASSMLPHREELGERLLVTSAFSKTWAMTGWRVGYAIGAEPVIKGMLTVQGHDATQAASMCQKAALAAATVAADAPKVMLEEYRARREIVLGLLAEIPGVRCLAPRGAFYAFPDVSGAIAARGLKDSVEFCAALLREKHVALVPGEAFGAPGHVRISYAAAREALRDGLARIKEFAEGR